VALTTLYLDNVLRVRHPPGRRPKGVQKCPRLRKYLNLQAEGGRFEPGQRRGRVRGASALKPLCRNELRPPMVDCMASRNCPERPSSTRPNPERFRVRGPGPAAALDEQALLPQRSPWSSRRRGR